MAEHLREEAREVEARVRRALEIREAAREVKAGKPLAFPTRRMWRDR